MENQNKNYKKVGIRMKKKLCILFVLLLLLLGVFKFGKQAIVNFKIQDKEFVTINTLNSYNTGNKDFIYNDSYVDKEDSYRHSKWLSFMSRRLKIAKKLLSDRPSWPEMFTSEIVSLFVSEYKDLLDLTMTKEDRFVQLKEIGKRL